MSDHMLYEVRDGAAWVTLNRPDDLNAMDQQIIDGYAKVIARAEADPDVKVVVFTGAGRAFSAGADLKYVLSFIGEGDVAKTRQFMNGALEGKVPDATPNIGDWNNHLSTLFPDVRLKKYIEMRGADGGPWRRICALPALWVGLLYDKGVLDQAWELVKDWTQEERAALRAGVPKTALQTPFRSGTVLDVAKQVLALSQEGLKRRNRLSDGDLDERVHLAPIEEGLASGMCPADVLLQRYNGSWKGDISQVFRDYAY